MTNPAHPSRVENILATVLLAAALAIHLVLVKVGWSSGQMAGNEFRQVQTAITALFAFREGCHIDYPMPLLGSPWTAPLEFPFYQWSVAKFMALTGWPVVQAGRAVSVICFYATLPAVWLLLRRAGLPGWHRRLALALILACPVYIFYSRGVTIEPLALLLSIWFLAALVEAVIRDSIPWLAVTIVTGVGAGLEKITTWMLYLLPVGVWLVVTAFRAAKHREPWAGRRWQSVAVVCCALVVPSATAVAWVRFSDALKADHVESAALVSDAMTGHNFGTLAVRVSTRFWTDLLHMWTISAGPPLLWCAVCVLAGWAGRWRFHAYGCLGLFFAAPLIFPILYSWHDYYFYANTVLLAAGASFVFAGLRERWRSPVGAWIFLSACFAVQFATYFKHQYPAQQIVSAGGSGLTHAIRDLTQTDDVLVIAGQDWHGFIPFYSERRALMIRRHEEERWEKIKMSFDHLRDDFVALLVLDGEQRENRELLRLAVERLGIDPRPLAAYHESVVYANRAVRWDYISRLHASTYDGVQALDQVVLPEKPNEGRLRGQQMDAMFRNFSPKPYRYSVPYSLACYPAEAGGPLTAHSPTSLWFRVAPGRRHVHVEFGLMDGSYAGKQGVTDGIALEILAQQGGTEELRHRHLIDPAHRPEDRGVQADDVDLDLAAGAELIVRITPGPHGDRSFDWGYLKRVRID